MKKVYEKQAFEEFTKKYKRGKGETIKGRSSTIVRTVYKNLMPWIEFQDKDLKKIEDYFGDIRNCVYCGKKANTVDHINPLIGEKKPTGCINEPNNILPCCSDCNSKKGGNDWKCMELPSENKERLEKFTNENKVHKFQIEGVINPKTNKKWIDEIQEDIDEINQKLSILDKKCALIKHTGFKYQLKWLQNASGLFMKNNFDSWIWRFNKYGIEQLPLFLRSLISFNYIRMFVGFVLGGYKCKTEYIFPNKTGDCR